LLGPHIQWPASRFSAVTSRLHQAIDGIGAIMLIGAPFDTTPDALAPAAPA